MIKSVQLFLEGQLLILTTIITIYYSFDLVLQYNAIIIKIQIVFFLSWQPYDVVGNILR